jgi:hypothetical protein
MDFAMSSRIDQVFPISTLTFFFRPPGQFRKASILSIWIRSTRDTCSYGLAPLIDNNSFVSQDVSGGTTSNSDVEWIL